VCTSDVFISVSVSGVIWNSPQGTLAGMSQVSREGDTPVRTTTVSVVSDTPDVVKYVIVRSSLVFYCLFSMGGYFRVNNDFFEKCVNLALPSAALLMCQSIKSVYVKV